MKNLKELLQEYQPNNKIERNYKQRTLQFLMEYHNPYSRELLIGHVTASAFLINSTGNKFLLMHHKKIDKWFQPGGHCDGDRNVLNVALKEAKEESGIKNIKAISKKIYDVDIHRISSYKNIPAHDHFDIRFLLQTIDNDLLIKNSESKELRWIEIDNPIDLSLNLNNSVLRMIEKYKNFLSLVNKLS